jgi:signal transduction histidine kinase
VKHLAHHFNGSVSVRSEVDRGSTFEVLLPNASDQQNPLVHAQVY